LNRLREHDTVVVTVPQGTGGGFEATVLVFSERGMTLQAKDKVRLLRIPEVVPGAFVTFRYEKSLVALPGTLYCVKPVGDLRFQVSEASLHRTRGTRLKFEMPISVRRNDSEPDTECVTIDIGPDGMLFECDLETAVGDHLTVSCNSQHYEELVSGAAEVVRTADGLVAVKLPPESAELRNLLGEIVVARSRSNLARTARKADVGPGF
jgi:PilZ domain